MIPHILLLTLATAALSSGEDPALPPMPPVQGKSAAEEAKTFELPPGYHLQLVLSEPEIKEPVVTAFDGDGRMFVAEMRTYMQDIDGNGQRQPTSRISMHVSTRGDGVYDKHTVFVDNLMLPRMILPLGKGQIVVNETDSLDLYLYTDTDGDGVADKKELWWQGGPRGGNLEHQPSGLVWALDNAIYTTYNAFRLRWTPKGVVKEETKPNDGQWGLGQDNYGSLYYVNAGGEKGPVSFQAPVVYGMFNPQDQFENGFKELFPAVGARDFQGGPSHVREPEGTLSSFTSGAGIDVYRGDQLPRELLGDVFFGEPVGRLVRRAKVADDGALKVLSNPYQSQKSEFLRSKDLCFRPVNMTNAPDGTLYITDMYRGIIQEASWVNPGSYLRKIVEQYRFDQVTGHGRIWRLVHDSTKPVEQPRMFSETAAQLVTHLAHPNGWWRDTAQRLLVLRQDRSAVPVLEAMVRDNPQPLARIHALWTLQGLNAASPVLIREKMTDSDPQVRCAAIRVSESLYLAGDASFRADIEKLVTDPSPEVVLQACMTAKYLAWPDHLKLVSETVLKSKARGIREIGAYLTLAPGQEIPELSDNERAIMKRGETIFATLCATCHGETARGVEIAGLNGAMLAPPLAGSHTINGDAKGGIYVLLKGLQGEIAGKKYEGLMISMASNDDQWVSDVLSYVRNSFGNRGSFVSPAEIAQARKDTAAQTEPWTYAQLHALLPTVLPSNSLKVTANNNGGEAGRAIDGSLESRYTTGKFMAPGMWFQIGLKEATPVIGLVLDSNNSPSDYPRGYEVTVSTDGTTWSQPIATGKGSKAVTEIRFPETTAKFIRITQTGRADGNFWSIHELQVLGKPEKSN
ncbi:MAG: coagulation factor 5/8 type domain protein [Akkermansiaceae bacterium]|nr:coagulation factor 5/8 type domain protein [Akkermansiaceae bacterium]